MAGASECWVTTGLDEEQCVNALILARSLKRVMTLRKLVILISSSIPQEFCEILQVEFDVCICLDVKRILSNGTTAETFAKVHCWSLVKWEKVIFLEPHCLVVRNCDELFKLDGPRFSSDWSVFLIQPSLDTWRILTKVANGGNMDNGKILENLTNEKAFLEADFNRTVDLLHGSLATNLDEINIINFIGTRPLEILYRNNKNMIKGYLEKAFMNLWEILWENGVIQLLKGLTSVQLNGLKNYVEEYKMQKTPTTTNYNDDGLLKDCIAIVGMSCRFPGANNVDEFWKLLIEGGDAMGHCPEGRWAPERCVNIPEEAKSSVGGFLNVPLDEFDGKFFGMSPAEMAYMDPQQRLTLQVAWEALEDAGIDPLSIKSTFTGVFGGAWRLEYEHILQRAGAGEDEFVRTYLGNSFGAITARISHCLGLTGPSIGTESGCSSSMVAVHMACKSLATGQTDLSLACGVNLLLRPFTGQTMHEILAEDGHCKTFDESADGFARAEGCGVLVLKRFADAVKDGDRIWGLIRGTGVVQEGASRSLGTPTKYCEALAMKMALKDAKVEPKDVSFVETHGTGTPVGDPLEVAAIAEVYSKGREEPLVIGSVKTNIGHTEACSGIAGIIKVILSLKNELIPPHKNFQTLNSNINLEAVPAKIPLKAVEWKRDPKGKPRIAGVSSFGITGTDAHAIIQESPDVGIYHFAPKICPQRPSHILTLSAKAPEALEDNLENFKAYLKATDQKFGDIAHTANIGRGDFPFRVYVVGKTNSDVLENMKNMIKITTPQEHQPKVCFLFTGQGSQYPGMAKSLYDHNPIFKIHFDICDAHLSKTYGISMREAIWGNTLNLGRTIYSQTSIFCVEYCLLKLWESWGIKPDFVLGHSLGEFAAAVAAGILSFEDGLKLVGERSQLIDGLGGGKMLVLKENSETVENLLEKFFKGTDKWLDLAAVNSPEQTVLAGSEENIGAFSEFCKTKNIKSLILEASHAFHSRHMDPILEKFRKIASSIKYSKATCVYVSGMEGRVVEEEGHVNADYWVRHTREKVQFLKASKVILGLGCTLFLEVGPQPVLSAMIMINSDEVSGIEPVTCLSSIRKQAEDWTTILNSLGKLYLNGMNINWKRFDQFENLKTVTAPFYPFQNKPHWYDIPDQGIRQIHPLVGTPVSNASNLKLFENKLAVENTKFLKDHVIGNKMIFPGAGFMEMCLLAGHAATQCTDTIYVHPTAPITIENFTIESPLGLPENKTTTLQAIVTSEDSGETKVTIYSKLVLDKETQKWIRHASGIFSPYAVQNKEDESHFQTMDKIMEQCRENLIINGMYEELANLGLKFGPVFQSLKAMWKGQDQACFEVKVPDNPENYICHPVLLDSLLQAVMITLNPELQKLHVPVSVTRLVWYAKIVTPACFIHCKIVSNDAIAVLYDGNGQVLAKMMGATFMETTVGTIMSSLEAQHLSLPAMFETVWKPQMGPFERQANLTECFPQALFEEPYITQLNNKFNPLTDQERIFTDTSNKLYSLFMIKCLYDLGWVPEARKTYELNEMTTSFKIIQPLYGFLRFMLMQLSNDGLFEITNTDRDKMSFRLVQTPPTLNEVLASIEELHLDVCSTSPKEVELVTSTGRHLALFLTGKQSALPILFPDTDDPRKPSANSYYMESLLCAKQHQQVKEYYGSLLRSCSKSLAQTKKVLRILEVGAGTGSATKATLPFLDEYPEGYEYTYTDVSQAFFAKGRQIFENSKVRTLYRTLNIEEDVATQGYIPFHYDLIIANNVIHVTQSVTRTMGNLRNLLKDDGMIVICESIRPARNTNFLFGLLDGYWLFKDYDLRPYNCEISLEKWNQVLRRNNFDKVAGFKCFDDHLGLITAKANSFRNSSLPLYSLPELVVEKSRKKWVVFSEENVTSEFFIANLKVVGNDVVTVTRSHSLYSQSDKFSYSIRPEEESDMERLFKSISKDSEINGMVFLWGLNYQSSEYLAVCKPFLSLCKLLIRVGNIHPKVIVITSGVSAIGDNNKSPPVPSLLWGMTKCFQNERPDSSCRCIDLDTNTPTSIQLNEAFSEIFTEDQEIFVAYRDNQRHVSRLASWKPQKTALTFPKTQRSKLILAPSKTIGDLKFGPMEKSSVGDLEIEVRVKAYGLNFRDVFVVMKPEAEWDNFNTVGIDFAGVISCVGSKVTKHKVGDAVLGCNIDGDSLASHVITAEGLVIRIPQNMTFNEAATLPAVASTAYLSLIELAKLTSKDTILIHTASGGVGLVAIQIAKSVGATIVATAGSKRKRSYLKTLGIQHIFHSRSTDYEREIRKALKGRGVDVVLNSLTSPGFKEASLSVCNESARFIEMSKLNTWTPEEVKALRPDVKYDIVDLSASTDTEMRDLLSNVLRLLDNFTITSIPYVRFDAAEIRDALNYLQKAKHIGKIVCVMPDSEISSASFEPQSPLFNNRSTYLITGGLGGIGFEVAKWMVQTGAKNIALVGRSAPKDAILKEIEKLNSKGYNVFSLQYDVGDMNQCKQLLEVLKSKEQNLPPLRGIMHAAGVLSDALFENQRWENYRRTYNPKVSGGWNLHECTLKYPLEHFVMFSSATACLGSIGQSNHASANFYLDSLASYRNSIGLPATTVNWGQWGQVGVAANMEIPGLKPFTILQGISALEKIMKTQRVAACVCEIDLYLIQQVFPATKRSLEDLKPTEEKNQHVVSNEQFWGDYDSATDSNGRVEAVKNFIRYVIRALLKLDDIDSLDDNADFQNLGMDSLMMIEMKNVMQSTFGKRATITVNSIKDCHHINSLSVKLTQIISGVTGDVSLTREELIKLIREDMQLSKDIQPPPINNYCKPSEIKTILMTGATGNFGPYILKDILQRYAHVQKIYCLVRGHTNKSPQDRLEEILESKGLLNQIPMEKVKCIDGSITKLNLGLTQEKYSELSEKIDAIIHLAVSSNLISSYKKIDGDKNMRAINVLGTINILRFAFSTKTKVMFHASSIVANGRLDGNKCMSETWPTPQDFDDMPDVGYPISKFICDILVGQAAERGLPVKVFRFPVIGGDSLTGKNAAIDNNQLMLRLMSYLHLGYMPNLPVPFFILPVDICSDLSLKIFFDDKTEYDVYNVYNPYTNSETEMVSIAQEMGYKLEILDLLEFQRRIGQTADSILTHFIKQATSKDNNENIERFYKFSPAIVEAFTGNPENAFFSTKLAKLIPAVYPSSIESTRSVIKRDLVYAKVSGAFDKYGV